MSEPAPDLPPLYYLHNFDSLLRTVEGQYADLLLPEEQAYLESLWRVSDRARALYVRLVSRVGPVFRSDKLSYEELGELEPLAGELGQNELLHVCESPDLQDLFGLCRKDELQQIFASVLQSKSGVSREALLLEIEEALGEAGHLEHWQSWYSGEIWQPLNKEITELLQLLFFGNRRQSLTDFVLSDLGVARHYPYALDRDYRLFETREHIEEYLQVGQWRELYYTGKEADDWSCLDELVDVLSNKQDSPGLEARWDKLRNSVARQLERELRVEDALAVYACSNKHPSRERRARLHKTAGDFQLSLSLCEEISQNPWCEAELDFVNAQIPQLQKKLALPFQRPVALSFPEVHLNLSNSGERVEMQTAAHYADEWQQVFYLENTLFNSLFGLAFWEEIFMPVRGAFVNPFQSAPLDMYSGEFYAKRKAVLEQRLDSVALGAETARIIENYERYQGTSCSWVHWQLLSVDLLETALRLIPPASLAAVFRRLLFDPQSNRSGFPDLVAFDDERGFLLIEVKGPGDQLQANQKRWFRYFLEQDIPFEVAWVAWQDDGDRMTEQREQ